MAVPKILVIKLRSLGDTVLMTAPILELIKAFPQAQVDVLVDRNWAPLFDGFPGVHKVWSHERRSEKLARTRMTARLGFLLRKEKYDTVLNFHASPSSAILSLATGASVRANHFHGHRDRDRYSTVTIPGKGTLKPIIERDMDTVRALDVHVPAGKLPAIYLQPSERTEGRLFLENQGLRNPVLGLSLGASRPTKSWPVDRFAALAISWSEQERSTLAIAGPGEDHLVQSFLKAVDDLLRSVSDQAENRAKIRSRIGATSGLSLRKLGSVLSQLSVLAGNDSGPRHLAVAVGTPTVTLFGPEDPFEWHPYPRESHPALYIANLACRKDADPGMPPWCGLNVCVVEENKCLRSIGADAVLEACLSVVRT